MSEAKSRRFRVGIGTALLVTMLLPVALGSSAAAAAPARLPASVTSWIVTLKAGANPVVRGPALASKVGGQVSQVYRHALNGFVFHGSATEAATLRLDPTVRTVVPNARISIAADTISTGVSRIRANHTTPPSAFAAGFTGAGVRVAVLDTGVDLTHPDLVPNLDIGLGRNCITTGPPQDGHGHGTHVAGIIAAAADGNGVVGVAPSARIVPIKVLDDTGQGEWSNLICAVDYLTGLMTDGDPSNDVRVANMSLGDTGSVGSCTDGGIREAICRSVAAGIVYVAAAGNSTVDASTFIPAAFPEVIAVSALTDLDGEPGGQGGCWLIFLYCDDTLAEFSNFGSVIAVTAPGTQIYSDWTGGTYQTESGTSMASPHVAGVAALVIAANPSLKPADVLDLIKGTGECPNGAFADASGNDDCVGKGQWGNDPDGYGEPLVNALHAAQSANSWVGRPTVHVTSPADGATVSGPVTITADASDNVGVAKVQFFVNGVALSTDTNGSDGWSATWNPSGLDAGRYTLKATATNTGGLTRSDSVTVQTGVNIQGSWVANYGADGYVLANWTGSADLVSLPAGRTLTVEQASRYSWIAPTSDVRALQAPSGTERRARTWYDGSEIRLRLDFATAYSGTLHLYALDWDSYGPRGEDITIDDGQGPRTASLAANSFVNGAWVHAPISVAAGHSVVITVDRTAGGNAVLGGLFLGGPLPPPPPPSVPGTPTGLAANAGNGQVALAWSAPASDGGSPITGYAIYRATSSGAETLLTTVGVVTSYTDPGLANGTTYYYQVAARNAIGEGSRSSEASAKPAPPPPPPPVESPGVQGSWVANYGADGYVLANWTGSADLVSLPAGRTLTVEQASRYSWIAPTSDVRALQAPSGTERRARTWYDGSEIRLRLDFATAYSGTLHLYALDWDSYGPRGEDITIDDGQGPRTASLAANSFVNGAWVHAPISVAAGHSVVITVDRTAGGNAVLGGLFLGPAGTPPPPPQTLPVDAPGVQGSWVANYGADGYVLANWTGSADLVSLPAGRTLTVEQASRYSWIAPTSDVRALQAPSGTERRARTWYDGSEIRLRLDFATAYSGTLHLYALDWDSYGPRGEDITIDDGQGPRTASLAANSFVNGAWVHAPISVAAGHSVVITVDRTAGGNAVLGGLFLGGPLPPPPPPSVPGTPTGLAANAGNGQVALAWSAPASDGGSPITGYAIYRATSSGAETLLTTVGVVTSYTDPGLTNGTTYYYQVAARNAIGEGSRSSEASAKPAPPPPPPPSVPGTPTGLAANAGNGQVALAWSAPASDGGSPITGYAIYRATSSGAETLLTTVGVVTSYTDPGLTNGTTYYYQVAARNAIGEGSRSSEASAKPATVPSAPRNVSAKTASTSGVRLTWSAPSSSGGSAVTGYRIYRSTSSGTEAFLVAVGNVTSYTDTATTAGVRYFYKVQAVNAVGQGALSSESSAIAK